MVKIIECPRDAMQGIKIFIPTEKKVAYLNQLLHVGFDTIDFGSFVSPKAIPQLKDTAAVLGQLDRSGSKTKLLAIVANRRGALKAAQFREIDYLGFPFSISETFQLRNTNASIEASLERVAQIQEIATSSNKELVIYISMGFGNPYGDPWNMEIVQYWVSQLESMGIRMLQLSDTIGVANPDNIAYLFSHLLNAYPALEIGAHFHTVPGKWKEKVHAAYTHGCRRFDGAIHGYGGCPMARDNLTGNMPTEHILAYLNESNVTTGIDSSQFLRAMLMADEIFP